MTAEQSTVFRWGVIATGGISTKVVTDLLVDPKTRDVHDVVHKIAAVGSRSVEKAQEFINTIVKDPECKAYGTYEEVYSDPNVDAVYIGSPHTFHYENARDAMKAGKAVLCEKPITSNAAELRSLIEIAKENKVFLMEAMWTRFQPLTKEIKKVVDEGTLGDIVSVHADLSGDFDIQNIPKTHRILDPKLGGGALLDLGPYPLIWTLLFLYENPTNNNQKPVSVVSSMIKTPLTGVDTSTSFTVTFGEGHLRAHSVCTCNITLPSMSPCVQARFRQGNIIIPEGIFRPTTFIVQWFDKPGSGRVVREEKRTFKYEGFGWHFQADEVARCVRQGQLESKLWGHDKSIVEMEIFDEVRRQGDYKLPDGVEKVL